MERFFYLAASVVFFALPVFAATVQDLDERVTKARVDYDLEEAEKLYEEAKVLVLDSPSPETNLTLGRAALLLAEFRRYEYEKHTELLARDRRRIGRTVDDAARVGHEALNTLENSSEKFRMKADLWALMIRSKYQGQKYINEMEKAEKRALAMNPNNPHAHVTASKMPLFATKKRGGDLALALDHLNRALEVDPDHEVALIFRGIAYDKLDQRDRAIAEVKRALEINPNSRFAQDTLEDILDEN